MAVYKPKGRANYSYEFQLQGHRFSGSTGTGNKREAEKVVERLKAEKKAELAEQAKFTAEGPMSFEIAASRYWLEIGQHLANSVDCFRNLGWLQGEIGKHTTLDKITDSKVALMVATRRGQGLSNASVNRYVIEPLRGLMRRAARVWKVPVADIDWRQHWLKEAQERIREASRDEEAKLLSAMRGDYAPAVRFAFLSGCRRAEIVGLTWQHVDFFGRRFTVTGKGDKTRTIPMTQAIYDLLWQEKDHHATAVFTYVVKATRKRTDLVRGERRPITMEGFKTAWRRFKPDDVTNFRFHDTRHTAATRTLRAGNLKVVQQMLGHTDIATTAKYAHAMVEDMRAAMEAANPIQNPKPTRRKAAKKL
jgi:integrase